LPHSLLIGLVRSIPNSRFNPLAIRW